MKIRINTTSTIVGLAVLGVSQIYSATVATVLGPDQATITSSIGAIATDDLAAGIATTRDFGGGNFNAAVTTDGAFGTGFNNNPSNGATPVRYQIDLGSEQLIGAVNTYSGTGSDDFRGGQDFTLYGTTVVAPTFDETLLPMDGPQSQQS